MAAHEPHFLDHQDAPTDAAASVQANWHRHHIRRFHPAAIVPPGALGLTEIEGHHEVAHVTERQAGA